MAFPLALAMCKLELKASTQTQAPEVGYIAFLFKIFFFHSWNFVFCCFRFIIFVMLFVVFSFFFFFVVVATLFFFSFCVFSFR
jgi:hypothetical protein